MPLRPTLDNTSGIYSEVQKLCYPLARYSLSSYLRSRGHFPEQGLKIKCLLVGLLAQSGCSLPSPNKQGQQKELIADTPPCALAPRWLTGACGRSGRSADRPAPR